MDNKTIDNIVWWIPFRKLRHSIRELILYFIDMDINTRKYIDDKINYYNNENIKYIDDKINYYNNENKEYINKNVLNLKELLIYNNNYLTYIENNDFEYKLEQLINNLDKYSKITVFDFINRIIKLYKYNDYSLKYMNEYEMELSKSIEEKRRLVIDFDDYQYYEGLKLTKKINMSYIENYNFLNIHSYEVLFDKYLYNVDFSSKNILDVGSCYGDIAIFLSKRTNRKVYSFEPVNKTYDILLETLTLNSSLTNIEPINMGISNYTGKTEIFIPTYNNGNNVDLTSSSISNPLKREEGILENINITTIDEFVQGNNIDVGFIKVDIEGEEKKLLDGARNTILKQKPYMVISIYHSIEDYFEIKPFIESYSKDYDFHVIKMMPYIGQYETVLLCMPRAEQSRAEQSRAEQSRAEQSRAEQS
uniref:FkbM family methyltransferase n=1 Tax=Brachyspira catarrhinii TaxID=2528966 RepID=UPI003F4BD7A9